MSGDHNANQKPFSYGQLMAAPTQNSEAPTLDVQSTIEMWQEAYQMVDAKLEELETLTKRIALDLECVLLNRDKWWDQAHETLQAYRDLMDRWYPQETVSPLGKD